MFDLDLLRAINNWQRGGDAKMKIAKAKVLQQAAGKLDERFRTVKSDCFRRLALKKDDIWKYGDHLYLEETISAWTTDLDFARGFKGGVPPEGELGVILRIAPAPKQVIVNLSALFADDEFKAACETKATAIVGFKHGIGRYGESQNEVVLKVDRVQMSHIHSLGGTSSSDRGLARLIFGHDPDAVELSVVRLELAKRENSFGPRWIDGEAKDRILPKWVATVECCAHSGANAFGLPGCRTQ